MTQDFWTPDPAFASASNMARFMRHVSDKAGVSVPDYDALWAWSVSDPGAFWTMVAEDAGIGFATAADTALGDARMPGTDWFQGATLNYTEAVMRHVRPDRTAILHEAEDGTRRSIQWADLQFRVRKVAGGLRAAGVEPGDRVVGYLPNTPETVIAFLATASLGAIWSLCAPDMGAPTVLERFRQIAPKVLITCSGYDFSGRYHERAAEVATLLAGLPSVETWVPMAPTDIHTPANATRVGWSDLGAAADPADPVPVPFSHPLWVVYSSGTTGAPKAIVHGHGGVVLEHVKLMGLHCDIGPDDVFSWYSSTGWIMWNLQVGGLLCGATIALAEGNPNHPDPARLWRFVDGAGVTIFGAGAAWYHGGMKAGVVPKDVADLGRLRMLGSTGSPLAPEAYDWLYRTVRPDIWIAPVAGGTDLAGAFLAGSPTLPVRAGEMQCRALGAAVAAFDVDGQPVVDTVGELVCTKPMPSMPLFLWGDDDGRRLHESYFDVFPGVWRHGDWVEITGRGSAIIYGRSDATINRHGIRMGTADIYRVVEDDDRVADSLVVDLEYLGRASRMILFVKPVSGADWDNAADAAVRAALRARVSPHHVPDDIIVAPDIPYTLTGKKLEVPIKRRLLGQPMHAVATPDALANPACLDWYDQFAEALENQNE